MSRKCLGIFVKDLKTLKHDKLKQQIQYFILSTLTRYMTFFSCSFFLYKNKTSANSFVNVKYL